MGWTKLLARISSTAYCLDLVDCMHQVHNVFHVSLIKPYRSEGRTQPSPPLSRLMTGLNGQQSKCLTTELLSVDVNVMLNT